MNDSTVVIVAVALCCISPFALVAFIWYGVFGGSIREVVTEAFKIAQDKDKVADPDDPVGPPRQREHISDTLIEYAEAVKQQPLAVGAADQAIIEAKNPELAQQELERELKDEDKHKRRDIVEAHIRSQNPADRPLPDER